MRHARAGVPVHVVAIPLWQRFWSETLGLHKPTNTSIIRTAAAQVRHRESNLEAENTLLKQKMSVLSQQLLAFQRLGVPKADPPTPKLSTSTDRHAPWTPSTERDQASSNSELASILRRISVKDEIAVAVSNKFLASDGYMLEAWCAIKPHPHHSNHLMTRFGKQVT
jgi:hypothetical protein